jgi:hypothetical protein
MQKMPGTSQATKKSGGTIGVAAAVTAAGLVAGAGLGFLA